MASSPSPEQSGRSYETSRIFCGHANFPEMIGGIIVYGGIKWNNHKEEELVITNNTLQK